MWSLILTTALLATLPISARDHDGREERRERKEEKRRWKEHEREEHEYWKQERRWEKHRFHEEREHDRDWDFDHPRHAHPCPRWMGGWWREPAPRRYVALVPGDPSRVYVFLSGRWVMKPVGDPRFRADLSGAFDLPPVAPPVPLPRLGLNLHVVLFD